MMKQVFTLALVVCNIFFCKQAEGKILPNWSDPLAYRPETIFFLHGFAKGNINSWAPVVNIMSPFFSCYTNGKSNLLLIEFNDPNGSIDTYDFGQPGWTDTLAYAMDNYLITTKLYNSKFIIVAHSMGGLAARDLITNSKYNRLNNRVNRIILLGVPNTGSPLGNFALERAKALTYGWMGPADFIFNTPGVLVVIISLKQWKEVEITGEAAKDLAEGSQFLRILNQRMPLNPVAFSIIYGKIGSPINFFISGDYFGGDGVVPIGSQLGENVDSLEDAPVQKIEAQHEVEPIVATSPVNYLLQALDSKPPRISLSVVPPETTDKPYVNIRGFVYDELLPADSQLVINVKYWASGNSYDLVLNNAIKPSDLWRADNPATPVAEFDETIYLPCDGAFTVTLFVKNPAGLSSNKLSFDVQSVFQPAFVKMHVQNPEGKALHETGPLYCDSLLLGWRGEGDSLRLSPGKHLLKLVYNGLVCERNLDVKPGENYEVTFNYGRTKLDVASIVNFDKEQRVAFDRGMTMWGGSLYVPLESNFCLRTLPVSVAPEGYCCTMQGTARGHLEFTRITYSLDLTFDWNVRMATLVSEEYQDTSEIINFNNTPVTIPAQKFSKWYVQVHRVPPPGAGQASVRIGNLPIIPAAFVFTPSNGYNFFYTVSAEEAKSGLVIDPYPYFLYRGQKNVSLNSARYTFSHSWVGETFLETGSQILISSTPCEWEDLAKVGYTVP